MTEPERLIGAREVARILGMSTNWVYEKASSGELPSYTLSENARRFRASDIEAWVMAKRDVADAG